MDVDALLALFVQYGYWIVFVAILIDNAGLPIPGELLLLIFGALARNGDFSLGLGVVVASTAALGGDSVGYWLGRLSGDRVLRTYCRITLGSGACLRRAVGYYHRYGTATVIVGRFVMGIRALLPPLAGSAGMSYRRFLLIDALGATLWSGLFLAIGYSFGWRLESVRQGYRSGSLVALAALTVALTFYLLAKLLRRRRYGPASLRAGAVARVASALWRLPSRALAGSAAKLAPEDDLAPVDANGQPAVSAFSADLDVAMNVKN